MNNTQEPVRLAGGILLDASYRIGMLHRNLLELQQWEIPGGKIKSGEPPHEAVVREFYEELGVKATVLRRIAKTAFMHNGVNFEQELFRVDVISGIPRVFEPRLFNLFDYFTRNRLMILRDQKQLSQGGIAMLRVAPNNFRKLKVA